MSNLEERRQQMLEFIVSNTTSPTLHIGDEKKGKQRVVVDQEDNTYLIQLFSKPSDFYNLLNISEKKSAFDLDTNHQYLKKAYQEWCKYIIEVNHQNLVPGAVLLQSQTNFTQSQLKNKSVTYVNEIGFLHKVVMNAWQGRVIDNRRVLGVVEKSILELRKHTTDHKYRGGNGEYFKELNLFNVNKEDTIEVHGLRPIKGGEVDLFYKKRIQFCPVCEKPEKITRHDECKKSPLYQREAQKRNAKRYQQDVTIIKSIDSEINFGTVNIVKKHLKEILPGVKLPKDTYKLAILT